MKRMELINGFKRRSKGPPIIGTINVSATLMRNRAAMARGALTRPSPMVKPGAINLNQSVRTAV